MNSKQTTGETAANSDLVRTSRDGDQFHYHWAARHCLSLLPGVSDLAAISIEGASTNEGTGDLNEGDELIDVGFYYGSEDLKEARLVRYTQLKHSTKHAHKPWTASGLNKTLKGFSARYVKLRESFSWDELREKLRFTFTTNRPVDQNVSEALEDLANEQTPRHRSTQATLLGYAALDQTEIANFFQLFKVETGEPDLWNQRNLLFRDLRYLLADADSDAPLQLKELVARKATSEFAQNPSIRRTDVLRALRTDVDDLLPAPCLIKAPGDILSREQESDIRATLESTTSPIVLHADGGVGKSVLALQLSRSVPAGSVAVLYDCFGDGLYRTTLHFRHRHKDALPQIANELAAQGLCIPFIPAASLDGKQYMRAFVARLQQAINLLRAKEAVANLYLIVDAADNAVMAASEVGDTAFVPDLVRTQMPDGVKLVLTCRTHRQAMLDAPPEALRVRLKPFSETETARLLRRLYPQATDAEVTEFAFLSSANPRVQALALSRKKSITEMLKGLGPTPSTVEQAIDELLQHAVDQLKYRSGRVEAGQIDLICQGLAILRPLVPIAVLAQVSGTTEGAVKSFAFDLGRPLLVKGDSLHFLDEPSETWFREKFYPEQTKLKEFLERLRPLAETSSYVASALPQLLLAAGRMDELVSLALSQEGLPASNPLERRDIAVQRLTFALKACLQEKRYAAAAKLALKVAGELAGVERQNSLIQKNTDIASVLLSADRIEELVSRRTFGDSWMGAHHAYDAGLLAGRDEFLAEARSRLRIANDWLRAWAQTPQDEREQQGVDEHDIAELAMARLFTAGPKEAADFLRGWSPRHIAMDAGKLLGRRLVDLGRFDSLDELAVHGASDVWLMLGLASEACEVGHSLPAVPVQRLLRALAGRRVQLKGPDRINSRWTLLNGVTCAVMQALQVLPRDDATWARVLRRYLPEEPPREFSDRFSVKEKVMPLRAYALEAALLAKPLTLTELAPVSVRELLGRDSHLRSSEAVAFERSIGGVLHWFTLNAEITCGRIPADFPAAATVALNSTNSARSQDYQNFFNLEQTAALEWVRAIRNASTQDGKELALFQKWFEDNADVLWPDTLIEICRIAARNKRLEALAMLVAVRAFEALESLRDDAETRSDSYQRLARSVYPVSKDEAILYFDRAVEISNRIGMENLDRWGALLSLAQANGKSGTSRPWSAYRLARGAELTYEYVARDKHFDWESTVEGLLDLCGPSTLAILSRWRDRNFGSEGRLLKIATESLVNRGLFPLIAPLVLSPIGQSWHRTEDIVRAVEGEADKSRQRDIFQVGYRYLRVDSASEKSLMPISELCQKHGLDAPDIKRLLARERSSANSLESTPARFQTEMPERSDPDWNVLFDGVNLSNPEELRGVYQKLRTFDPPYRLEEFYQEGLQRCGIGGAAEFCRLVARWPDFGNFELRYLLDAFSDVKIKPLSLRKALGEAALAACRGAPEWARRNRWGSVFPYRQLIDEGIVSDDEIVDAALEGFLSKVTALEAGELFQLLEPLAFRITSDEADEALHFGLQLLEEDLRPDDGDGPWSKDLSPPVSCEDAMAAYLWVSLGSPSAAARWQAAHAVRASVELRWSNMLQALSVRAVAGAPGPFIDKRFEFYLWHARQWLLIALARCAVEDAEEIHTFGDFLLTSVKEEHVLLRHFAAQALSALPDRFSEEAFGNLSAINAPALPVVEHSSYRNHINEQGDAAEPAATDDDKYYFGIDIGPYWFQPLGRAFGITEGAMARRSIRVIRERLGGLCGRLDDDIRQKHKVFDYEDTRHSHGSMPRVDDLRAYHAYHAMMIVAAQLLKTHSVGKAEYNLKNDFEDWLEYRLLTRGDGKWIADRRDPQLTKAAPKPDGRSSGDWCWQVSAQHLDSLLITDEGLHVVSGDWTSGEYDNQESISILSALVPKPSSAAFLAAAQTAASVHDIYFQLDDDGASDGGVDHDGDDARSEQTSLFKLRKWISSRSESNGIDEYDPWGERLHFPGDEPDTATKTAMALRTLDDGRHWVAASGATMCSETWTQSSGYGREEETIPGTRLSCDQAFLRELLVVNPEHHLIIRLALRRRRPRYGPNADESDPYPAPYVRYYLIKEEDGITRTLRRSH